MKKWIKKFNFSQESNKTDPITSISITSDGDQVYTGTKSGQIYLYERRVDGSWDKTISWTANHSIVDAQRHQKISEEIIDTDIFTIQKKSPLLITAGIREIRIWFVTDRYEATTDQPNENSELGFPKETSLNRLVTANEISLFQTANNFSSIRACQDGLSFAYTEYCEVGIRRIDRAGLNLMVYKNDNPLTRVDFEPNHYDIILTGDEKGNCSIIDLRIQPQTNTPTCRSSCASVINDSFVYVSDCRFSPDGTKFFSRHFDNFLIWDVRKMTEPVVRQTLSKKGGESIKQFTQNGTECFKSTWVNNNYAVTGWLGGEMFSISNSGEMSKIYVTKNAHKKKQKFFMTDKKSWQIYHSVLSVDIPPNGCRAAASNGGQIFIYDLE